MRIDCLFVIVVLTAAPARAIGAPCTRICAPGTPRDSRGCCAAAKPAAVDGVLQRRLDVLSRLYEEASDHCHWVSPRSYGLSESEMTRLCKAAGDVARVAYPTREKPRTYSRAELSIKVGCVSRIRCSTLDYYTTVAGAPLVTAADHPGDARAYDWQFLTASNEDKNWYSLADGACALKLPAKHVVEEKCRSEKQTESLEIALPRAELVGPLSRQTLVFDCKARCNCANANDCTAWVVPR